MEKYREIQDDVYVISKPRTFYLIGIIISLVSFFIAIELLFSPVDSKGIYSSIWIIPVSYGILNAIFLSVYKNISLTSGIFLAFMFIRYDLTSFFILIEGFPRSLYVTYVNADSEFYAIAVMVFEMLLIFVALYNSRYKQSVITTGELEEAFESERNFSKLNFIILGIILITIAIYAVYPSLFTNYTFILNSDMDSLTSLMTQSQASLPGGMRWIGYTLGELTRYIVLQWAIIRLYHKYRNSGSILYWWISIILISLNAVIATSRIMMGLIMSIALFYQIYILYPTKRKVLVLFFGGAGALGVLMIALSYWTNILSYTSVAQVLQGYSNGYYNVYTARQAYISNDLDFADKLEMFFLGDGLANINIISRFVSGVSSSDIYNYYIYGRAFNGGAVVPLVSQLSYYFSPFIAPWFSYLCVRLSKKYELKSNMCQGSMMLSTFSCCMFALLPFMYNWTLLLHIVSINIVPIWICSKLNMITIGRRSI